MFKGTSTLLSYICFLLDNLKDIESKVVLQSVLDVMQKIFEESVNSVRLKCNACSNSHVQDTAHLNESILMENNYIVDDLSDEADVSWFFMDDKAPVEDTIPKTEVETAIPLENEVNIWKGLSHCLDHDFNLSLCDDDIALPMRIAVEAASYLLGVDIKHDHQNIPTGVSYPMLSRCLSFELVQGKSIEDAVYYPGAVIEFCEKLELNEYRKRMKHDHTSVIHIAGHGTQLYTTYQQALEHHSKRVGRRLDGLQRVAIVDLVSCADDTSASQLRVSGNGGSQNADSIQLQVGNVFTCDSAVETESVVRQLNRNNSYIERALSNLMHLGIQVLLCPYSISLKLLDACYNSGICVVPMSIDNLHIMAKLVGAIIMEDILDLHSECLGCMEHDIYSRRLQIKTQDCMRRVSLDGCDTIYKSPICVMLILQVIDDKKQCVDSGVASIFHCKHHTPTTSFELSRQHVSIVIPCPTAVLGKIMTDRIRKCINRITLLASDDATMPTDWQKVSRSSCRNCVLGKLVPGGGVVEVVCALYLQDFMNQDSNFYSVATVPYVEQLVDVVRDYCYTVNANCGTGSRAAMTTWMDCLEKVRDGMLAASFRQINTTPAFKHHISQSNFCEIPCPIIISSTSKRPLDVAILKIDAMRTACSAVNAILGSSHVIGLD